MIALTNPFRVDVRSLALWRVSLGLVAIGHLLLVAVDMTAFTTDRGVLPRWLVVQYNPLGLRSLYLYSGELWWSWLLMTLSISAAICFIIGYRTKLANIVLCVMIWSLQERNQLILQSGDILLMCLLSWALLLPTHACWSLDKRMGRGGTHPNTLCSFATAGALLQMCCMYFVTGLSKSGMTWENGIAVLNALQCYYARTTGRLILEYHGLLVTLNYAVRYLEISASFFLLLPFWQPFARYLVLPALIVMHLSFCFFLNISIFSFDSIAGLTLFIPSAFWQTLSKYYPRFQLDQTSHSVVEGNKRFSSQTFLNGAACMILAAMFYSNVASMNWVYSSVFSRRIGSAFNIDQSWHMFAPDVNNYVRWSFMIGTTKSNKTVYPLQMSYELPQLPRPSAMRDVSGRNLWLKVQEKIMQKTYLQVPFLAYWCYRWNETYPDDPMDKIEFWIADGEATYPPVPVSSRKAFINKSFTMPCDRSMQILSHFQSLSKSPQSFPPR